MLSCPFLREIYQPAKKKKPGYEQNTFHDKSLLLNETEKKRQGKPLKGSALFSHQFNLTIVCREFAMYQISFV